MEALDYCKYNTLYAKSLGVIVSLRMGRQSAKILYRLEHPYSQE
jgi:hypothetical protein